MKYQIPIWIKLFGGTLAIFGLFLGIMGYFKPYIVISGFAGDTNAHNMAMWMTSGRNIAMGVVMLTALLTNNPRLIALAFIMRLVTECTDMFATAASGVMGLPTPAVYAVYLLLFITPEILAIKTLNALSNPQNK